MSIGWQHASSGNAFFTMNDIVAMVRFRMRAWWAYDLTSEDWTPTTDDYSPLRIAGPLPSKESAMRAVEQRFGWHETRGTNERGNHTNEMPPVREDHPSAR